MAQSKPRLKFTIREYMTTPEDKRYQLLDGEMILAPSPTTKHQRILLKLLRSLSAILVDRDLGLIWSAPLDVVLSDYDVAQPDILFVSNERADIITEANIQGAPDLVVEVLSPSTAGYDRGYKQVLYGRHGVREYWIVDPDAETVDILVEGEDGLIPLGSNGNTGELTTALLQGLTLNLDELFHRG